MTLFGVSFFSSFFSLEMLSSGRHYLFVPSSSISKRDERHLFAVQQQQKTTTTWVTRIAPDGKGCGETAGAPMTGVGRPIATAMRRKLQTALEPTVLEIVDESWQHAGHAGNPSTTNDGSAETHFVLDVVSEKFQGMKQVARQRHVYALLEEEFNEKGLHALQMSTKTPEEYEKTLNTKT